MTTRASRKQAIALIQSAVKSGFSRTVEASRIESSGRVYAVLVSLKGEFKQGGLFTRATIYVSFRRGFKQSSVAVSSRCDYTGKQSDRGLFHALYAVRYVKETAQRFGAVPQGW